MDNPHRELRRNKTGFYNDIFDTNGWDKLAITTNSQFNDDLQAEAAGRLEGYLSKDRILCTITTWLLLQAI